MVNSVTVMGLLLMKKKLKSEDHLQNKAIVFACKKVLFIAQQRQNIGKVVLGQGSYLGHSVFKKF